MGGNKFYAVRVGRTPGIYNEWSEVQPLVSGYPAAQHKSFKSRSEAEAYLSAGPTAPTGTKRSRSDDTGPGASGSGGYERHLAPASEPPAQVRRVDPFADRLNYPQVTSGVLIAVRARADIPPRTSSGGAYNQPFAPAGFSTGSAGNQPHRPSSNTSRGGSPFDAVIEGPLQPIREGSVYELEFDGAARGNPGKAGCGALLRYNGVVVCRLRKYMGARNTNNEAEYTALIEGLKLARRVGVTRVHAKGDSKLVVMQVTGKWKINKDHLQALCDQVHQETRLLAEFEIGHIRREFNGDADKLSNDAIDLAYQC